MITLNDVSVTIKSDSIEKIRRMEFPEKWIEDFGRDNIKEHEFSPLKGRLGIQIKTTSEIYNVLDSILEVVKERAFERIEQIEYCEIQKVYKKDSFFWIKIFRLEGMENKRLKCAGCGNSFSRENMTIKYDKNSMQMLGYYCENCW